MGRPMQHVHSPQYNVVAKNWPQQIHYAFVAGKPGIKGVSGRPALRPVQRLGPRYILLMSENLLTFFRREERKRPGKSKRCKTFNKLQLSQSYCYTWILASRAGAWNYRFAWHWDTPKIEVATES